MCGCRPMYIRQLVGVQQTDSRCIILKLAQIVAGSVIDVQGAVVLMHRACCKRKDVCDSLQQLRVWGRACCSL